jgi:hypothetical protein
MCLAPSVCPSRRVVKCALARWRRQHCNFFASIDRLHAGPKRRRRREPGEQLQWIARFNGTAARQNSGCHAIWPVPSANANHAARQTGPVCDKSPTPVSATRSSMRVKTCCCRLVRFCPVGSSASSLGSAARVCRRWRRCCCPPELFGIFAQLRRQAMRSAKVAHHADRAVQVDA